MKLLIRALVCLLSVVGGILFGGCASTQSGDKPHVLSGPSASVELRLPDGTPPFAQMRKFPDRIEFYTTMRNLAKELGVTVVITREKIDTDRSVDAVLEEILATMREVYTNPQIRSVGCLTVLGKSVPVFESRDGTGDDSLSASIPLRRGSTSIRLDAKGDDNVSQQYEFFKELLEGASIREK
jgi:hypothetical protein